jgi:nucleoside-diphosphate-sugar epimerase
MIQGEKMLVCITGANGFIGRQLVETMSKDGHSIRILSRKNKNLFPDNVEVFVGDLTKSDCPLDAFMSGCDVLLHCAGEVRDVDAMRTVHVDGTARLIQAALNECSLSRQKIHWVQLSSCGAYGPPAKPQIDRIVTEDTESRPANEYEITKTLSDNLLIAACKDGQMTFSILRPSNVFGAQMTNQSLRKLVNMVKRRRFFYFGKRGAITTYVHVNDVVAALSALAFDPRAKGEIYNLSNDCTLEELISEIASLSNVSAPTLRIPGPLIRIPIGILSALLKKWIRIPNFDSLLLRTRYPTSKIEMELGFKLSMPMPNSIKDLV